MIIRSQDKKSIVNFEVIDTIHTVIINPKKEIKEHYKTSIKYFCGDGVGELGIYSTEEKAIKVLDMIQSRYAEGSEWLSCGGKVFQMPSDEEVEV